MMAVEQEDHLQTGQPPNAADMSLAQIDAAPSKHPPDPIGLAPSAHERLALIETVMEQVDEMVLVTDTLLDPPGPRIVYVNPAFQRQTGYTADEVLGRSPRLLQGPRTDQRQLDRLRRALDAGEPFTGETVNYRKNGEPYDLEWHVTALRDAAGGITHYVSIQRDVTARRRREEIERLHEAELAHATRLTMLGELASGLAHELNQPLTAIHAFARGGLMRLENGTGDIKNIEEPLRAIAAQADRAGKIILRLRSMVERRLPRRSTVSLNDLVEEVLPLAAAELARLNVRLELDLDPAPPHVLADSIQIEQVVLNLVRNGVEAMSGVEPSRRTVKVSTLPSPQGGRVELRVRDAGEGMSDEAMAALFQPFKSSKPGGLGLGLTLSQSIVESHGGRLTATRNTQGPGMTFMFSLPAIVSNEGSRGVSSPGVGG